MTTRRILIVEDESIVALDLRNRLQKAGFEVVGTASTGLQAVEKAASLAPDLILMDIHLKGEMDGIQAAGHIHASQDTPIIFLTAFADDETLDRARSVEPYGYLLKPFEERELQTAVEIALHKHQIQAALTQREAFYRALTENSTDLVIILDDQGLIRYVSPSSRRLLGYGPDEILNHWVGELVDEREHAQMLEETRQVFKKTGSLVPARHRLLHHDGSWRVFETVSHAHVDDPVINGVVVNGRDVTDRVQAEAALRESEERFNLAVQGANDGLWDWDLRSGQIYFSPRWKSMLGYAQNEVGDTSEDWYTLVHPEDLDNVRLQFNRHVGGQSSHLEVEHRMLRKDGSYCWVLVRGLAVRNPGGAATRMAGSLTDITPRKQAEARLVHDALHDSLTGLPNRALLMDRLGSAINRASRHSGYLFAVFFIDLDSFKLVNDSFGHDLGDKLLVHISKQLLARVRSADTVARLGGDEFVLLLDDLQSTTEALRVAERVLEGLNQPVVLDTYTIYTSGSLGLVIGGPGYTRPEDLLRDADIAMYRAKSLGKARYVVFNTSMRNQVLSRLEVERDLRRALEQEEFVLHYQPIISLENGRISGFEALIRWKHPTRGLLAPADFISIAEEVGLISDIGNWVLRRACWQIRHWQERFNFQPPLSVNVNVSARQFESAEILDVIENILQETGLPPSSLRLEIMENVFIEHSEFASWVLNRLKERGVLVEVDDFGTGYSALSYLQNLPVSSVKIDRSFIQRIGTGHTEIIASILRMTHDLGLKATAEGVETAEQLNRLKEMACPYGQGYFISLPLDAASIEELLQNTRQELRL